MAQIRIISLFTLIVSILFFGPGCEKPEYGDDYGSYPGPGPDNGPDPVYIEQTPSEPEFNIAGSKLLLAHEDVIASSTEESKKTGLFTYTKVKAGSPLLQEAGGSNLVAVDPEGNARSAIETDHPVKVMYTVTDPAGEYVYMALDLGWWGPGDGNDYSRFIGHQNCAFFKVSLRDNSYEPVVEGMLIQSMDQSYRQAISSDQKPIQFDNVGNLYFAATEFTRYEENWEEHYWNPETEQEEVIVHTNYRIDQRDWNPRIYRLDNSTGEITAITQDIQAIDYFLVLPTGELAYHSYDRYGGGNDRLWLWQDGTTIDLSSSLIGSQGVDFFAVDTANAVIWGEWNSRGVWFARPHEGGGVEKAVLDTNLFGGNQHGDSKPRRMIVADDGRLYGVFESHQWDNAAQQGFVVMSVYQVLPYDAVPKLELTLSDNCNWWDWMRETPFQISKGYLYYVDTIDPGDYLGTRDVINIIHLPDRTSSQILAEGDSRYEIYNWRLSGNTLYFSGLDKSTTTVVSGEINTLQVSQGYSPRAYVTITETASAVGAVSQIQDIEVLSGIEIPENDGIDPSVTAFHTSPENIYSVSIDFSTYMDQASVEQNTRLKDDFDSAIEAMPIWIHQSLHLIPDLDPTGLGDSSTTSPLNCNTVYSLEVEYGAVDIFGRYLSSGEGSNPDTIVFATKPENGWYYSPQTDCGDPVLSQGGIAKFAGPSQEWTQETFSLGNGIPEHVRLEFSAKNFGWDGLNVVYWDRTEFAASNGYDSNWRAPVANLYLGNWSNLDYKTVRNTNSWEEWHWNPETEQDEVTVHEDSWFENNWKDGNTPAIMNGTWLQYRLEMYGRELHLYYRENGTDDWTESAMFAVEDLMERESGHNYTFLMRLRDPMVLDTICITELDAEGAVIGSPGDVLAIDFDDSIQLGQSDNSGDSWGFDDDLSAILGY